MGWQQHSSWMFGLGILTWEITFLDCLLFQINKRRLREILISELMTNRFSEFTWRRVLLALEHELVFGYYCWCGFYIHRGWQMVFGEWSPGLSSSHLRNSRFCLAGKSWIVTKVVVFSLKQLFDRAPTRHLFVTCHFSLLVWYKDFTYGSNGTWECDSLILHGAYSQEVAIKLRQLSNWPSLLILLLKVDFRQVLKIDMKPNLCLLIFPLVGLLIYLLEFFLLYVGLSSLDIEFAFVMYCSWVWTFGWGFALVTPLLEYLLHSILLYLFCHLKKKIVYDKLSCNRLSSKWPVCVHSLNLSILTKTREKKTN